MNIQEYFSLLKTLISIPSPSGEEHHAAQVFREFLNSRNVDFRDKNNNTWIINRYTDMSRPVIMLNSHIDTVMPASGWITDPYTPLEEDDRITGLGSNDAGGALVALLAVFLHFYEERDLPFNLVYAATAEEENSGPDGIRSILYEFPRLDFVIVGEPTGMELAVAEKGLLVLDCLAHGKAGHAARSEGVNALYLALDDIGKLRNFRFPKVSEMLGPVKLTVTQIEAGCQHNVIPDTCRFVVDIRTNELYGNDEVFHIISGLIGSEVKPRSFRLNSSSIPLNHPFVLKAREIKIPFYGSPTTSDQAVIPCPSVKIGPGDSARSHTAGEFILKSEILNGVQRYIQLLDGLVL